MGGERAINLVELFSADYTNRKRQPSVVAAFAGSLLDGVGVERQVKLQGNQGHGIAKAIDSRAQDFDGKVARVLDQRCCGDVFRHLAFKRGETVSWAE